MKAQVTVLLALVVLGQAKSLLDEKLETSLDLDWAAHKPIETKPASLMSYSPKISPPLHDGGPMGHGEHQSDKKFFGPPFPADYPEDKRPVPDKSILDKLKGPNQPYPAVQSKADFDKDFVKDENADSGSWKAQFEYDTLRNKMSKESADARNAGRRADKEAGDIDGAQGNSDRAGKDVDAAKKDLDDATRGDDKAKTAEEIDEMPPSQEKLEHLKKAIVEAEINYEKEKVEFAECERQLAEAKKNLEGLKAAQVAMEAKLAADTKFWVEQKGVKLNLQKTKEEAAHSKRLVADEHLAAARSAREAANDVLATKKAKNDLAQKKLQKEKAKLAKTKQDFERATVRLQTLRGYKPEVKPARSGAAAASALAAFVLVAMNAF